MESNALFVARKLFITTLGIGFTVIGTAVTRESIKSWKASKARIEQMKIEEFKRSRSRDGF